MRDGNGIRNFFVIGILARLKPTYEGWKLPGPGDVVVKLPGLKPTYEGWKLHSRPQSSNRLPGLKPTYEGWKHNAGFIQGFSGRPFEAYL